MLMSMAHRALAGSIYFRYSFYQGTASRFHRSCKVATVIAGIENLYWLTIITLEG